MTGFAALKLICLGGKVYGWTMPEPEAFMLFAHQLRHIWRKATAKPWATKSGWPIADPRNRSLMPARSLAKECRLLAQKMPFFTNSSGV